MHLDLDRFEIPRPREVQAAPSEPQGGQRIPREPGKCCLRFWVVFGRIKVFGGFRAVVSRVLEFRVLGGGVSGFWGFVGI